MKTNDAAFKAIANEAAFGTWGQGDLKANFLMCQEYYDFIEFLQDKLGFEEVNELQKEFDGSFYNPEL